MTVTAGFDNLDLCSQRRPESIRRGMWAQTNSGAFAVKLYISERRQRNIYNGGFHGWT